MLLFYFFFYILFYFSFSFPFQNYVPTVFENYTASFEIDKHRIELNMWDTSGKPRQHQSPPRSCRPPTPDPPLLQTFSL